MTCSHLSILLILWLFVASLQAQAFKVVKRSDDPTYVTLGETLVLNVTYEYNGGGGVGVIWSNNSGKLSIERFRNGGADDIRDARASIVGKATLVLRNTKLSDNGTYSIQVNPRNSVAKTETFKVIIQVQPTATLNDFNTKTVPENGNVYYSCEGKNGVPTSNVSWYWKNKLVAKGKILSLRNIKRDQAGSYTCKVQSGTLTDETVLEIIVQSQAFKVVKRSDDPSYVNLGETLVLNVTYEYSGGGGVGLQWRYSSGKLLIERFRNGGADDIADSRVSIVGKATLVLTNSKLSDNGTYSIRVDPRNSPTKTETFEVIIQVPPKAKASCSENGESFSCLCEGIGGNPPPWASWLKDNTKIKGPEYLTSTLVKDDIEKGGEGIYNCEVLSGNIKDVVRISLYKPIIVVFASEQNKEIATIGDTVKIFCKGVAFPPADYTLFHNETQITNVDGVKTILSVSRNDSGQYVCVARNSLGNVSKSFFLSVNDVLQKPTTIFTSTNTKEKSRDSAGFGWYIVLITLVCGIIVGIPIGMILLYGMSLRQRFKSKKDHSKPAHNYETPETDRESAAENSAYQELDLRNKDPENSYQALRMNTRRRMNNEIKIEDEAGYQELDKVREKEDNYQSLNRV